MYDNLLANVPTDLYIGGKWRKSSDNQRFDVIDPATEKPIASVASASVEDAKAAVDAASAAMEGWAAKKPRERAEVLRKAFELIIRDTERFAKLMTIENGKALADSRAEVAYAAEFFRWYAEEAVRNIGEVSRAPASGARIFVQHKPAGVAVLVTPWNFPAAMATRKIGPALAAGCAVVLKPASETPLTMLALMPVMEEAGVPAGVINVLPSRRSGPVVDAMLKDPRVRVVSFTGSTEVGRKLLHAAADNVVKPAMELGGNAPFIVFDDADVDAAIDGAMIAKMRNMGEACTAANRFYVHEKVHDEFAKKLTARMQALKLGNGLDDGVMLGPLVNADTRDKVKALVEDAVGKGASVLTGGKAPDRARTISIPRPCSTRCRTAPSCCARKSSARSPPCRRFSSEDEVVKRANDTEYGLVAYVYTRDLARGMRVSERLDFGMIGLNRGLVSDPAAPFGGMKQSGIGREGRARGTDGVPGDAIHLADVVIRTPAQGRVDGYPDAAARRDRRRGQDHQMVQGCRRRGRSRATICSRSRPTRPRWRCRRRRAGVLTEIRVREGDVVPVGAVVAVISGAASRGNGCPAPARADTVDRTCSRDCAGRLARSAAAARQARSIPRGPHARAQFWSGETSGRHTRDAVGAPARS